jgi:DNA-binding NtrC family response regulator
VLEIVAHTLVKSGCEVLRATDGATALKLVRTSPPIDLVISDVVMPGIRGPELLESVRKVSPATALMLISGQPDGFIPENVSFLPKPFTAGDLRAKVALVLAEAAEAGEALRATLESHRQLMRDFEQIEAETRQLQEKTRQTIDSMRAQFGRRKPPSPGEERT